MNYCTKCGSLYAQPGTCNCFAPPRPITPVIVQPQPSPVPLPYIGDPPPMTPWINPTTTTITYDAANVPFTYTTSPLPPHVVRTSGFHRIAGALDS